MRKNLFLFNTSSKFGSNTYLNNIIHHLPGIDYYVINKNDINIMGKKKNLIISPSDLKNIFLIRYICP